MWLNKQRFVIHTNLVFYPKIKQIFRPCASPHPSSKYPHGLLSPVWHLNPLASRKLYPWSLNLLLCSCEKIHIFWQLGLCEQPTKCLPFMQFLNDSCQFLNIQKNNLICLKKLFVVILFLGRISCLCSEVMTETQGEKDFLLMPFCSATWWWCQSPSRRGCMSTYSCIWKWYMYIELF